MWNVLGRIVRGAEMSGERQTLRQAYLRLSGDLSADARAGEKFEAGRSYFSIRLAELRLATEGCYLTEYIPMCACVLSFKQGTETRNIPFIAGADTIRDLLKQKAPEDVGKRIEFRNLMIASNIPVPGDNIEMYLALCRFK